MAVIILTFTAPVYAGPKNKEEHKGRIYYRYTNEKGVKVLNSNIPSKYAQKGYEIVNSAGKVIEVIPPALSENEAKEKERLLEILARYEVLKRRFGSLKELEEAKQRRLANINTNIAILKSNIVGLENKLLSQTQKAAQKERASGKVPQTLIKEIEDTQAEIKIAERLMDLRKEEYQEESDKFDKDILSFSQGETIKNASQVNSHTDSQ